MKRGLLAAAACFGIAAGAIGMTTAPADAKVSIHLSFGGGGVPFGFGGYGGYAPFYPQIYHQPYPYMYSYPAPMHRVCYPVVKVRKVVRHHKVRFVRFVTTACRWQY